jgi:hypothetical protein
VNKTCKYHQVTVKEEILIKEVDEIINKIKIPDKIIKLIFPKLKSKFETQSLFEKQKRKDLQSKISEAKNRKSKSIDILTDGSITKEDYAIKANEYEEKLSNLQLELSQLTQDDKSVHLGLDKLISLANRIPEVYKSSNTITKNKILKNLISNSKQMGRLVEFNLQKPYSILTEINENQNWCIQRDSNPRPLVPKTSALSS